MKKETVAAIYNALEALIEAAPSIHERWVDHLYTEDGDINVTMWCQATLNLMLWDVAYYAPAA